MSTYHPKTLKRWKVHKRSLIDLQQPQLPPSEQPMAKSQVIHSLDTDNISLIPPYPLRKERYRLDDGRNSNLHLSNGFRKVLREQSRLAFSKVVSEESFIRVDFASEGRHN
jgi:hypothetical protein